MPRAPPLLLRSQRSAGEIASFVAPWQNVQARRGAFV